MRAIQLVCLIGLALASPAEARWRMASSPHFVIYSEDKPENLAAFALEMERFDSALRAMLTLPDAPQSPSGRLTIFHLSSMAALKKVSGGGRDVLGFYLGRASGSVAFAPRRTRLDDSILTSTAARRTRERQQTAGRENADVSLRPEMILRHEYTHHFLFRNFQAAFPAWFSEGYAEFDSTAQILPDGSVDIGIPAYHRWAELLFMPGLSMEKLLAGDLADLTSAEMAVPYGRGWLLTHYLQFSKERAGQFTTYLAAINRGQPSLQAAREAFGDLGKLGAELTRYLGGKNPVLRLNGARLRPGAVDVTELSDGADALMDIHIRSRRGITRDEAPALAVEARKLAASYPADPFVQLALAEAERDARAFDACDQAADRVLAVDPKSVAALGYKGKVAVARLAAAKSRDAKAWLAGRRWFTRANRLDPDAPEPLRQFYLAFLAEGQTPSANAVTGLQAAADRAPEDLNLRMLLARQLLADDRRDEARAALARVAYDPYQSERTKLASRVLAALESQGSAAGLKALAGRSR